MAFSQTSAPLKSVSSARGPEINVTPLVDVVLVLLIIFMVIAPQLEAGERVELPGIVHSDATAKLEAVTVTVTSAGRTLLEKQPLERDELFRQLEKTHQATPEKRLVLKADRGVRYGLMRDLFASAQKVGFPGVALMVDEKKAEEGR